MSRKKDLSFQSLIGLILTPPETKKDRRHDRFQSLIGLILTLSFFIPVSSASPFQSLIGLILTSLAQPLSSC